MFTNRPVPIQSIDYAAAPRTVHFERFTDPDERTFSILWGLAKAEEARKRAEQQLHTHNILFNVAPRARDPAIPLAGTVFDPRRYRRP